MTPNDSVVPLRISERAKNPRVLRLHPDDNVIVSVDPILPGATAEGVTAVSRVPKGHKMATVAIAEGAPRSIVPCAPRSAWRPGHSGTRAWPP